MGRISRIVHRVCVLGALVVAMFIADAGVAQVGMNMGMGGGAQQMITRRELDAYSKILSMTPEQFDAAKVLLEGVQAQTRQMTQDFQKKMEAMMEKAQDGDFGVWQTEMPGHIKVMAEKAKALETAFYDDIKAILTAEQMVKWPSVERCHRRTQWTRVGFFSGAGVDLISLVERTKAGEGIMGDLTPLLDEYEMKIDDPVQAMQRMQEKQTQDYIDGKFNAFDMQAAQNVIKDYAETGKKMRDINREFARKIISVLPEDRRAGFELEFKRRSFSRVYRETHAQKQFAAAEKFADITPEQKESLASVREAYERDLASANDRWAKAVEEQEEASGGTFGVMMSGFTGQGASSGAVGEARQARTDLDKRTEERIEAILTAEQRERLPKKERRQGNPWMDMVDPEDLAEMQGG